MQNVKYQPTALLQYVTTELVTRKSALKGPQSLEQHVEIRKGNVPDVASRANVQSVNAGGANVLMGQTVLCNVASRLNAIVVRRTFNAARNIAVVGVASSKEVSQVMRNVLEVPG